MTYEVFKQRVSAVIRRAGGGMSVRFSTDSESGIHTAALSDGTTIIGNNACLKVEIHWGTSHMAIARI